MVSILKNVFQPLNISRSKAVRLDINVGKPQKEELGRGLNRKRVAIFRSNQKHMTGSVSELILVNALNARSRKNVNQLEKQMPMFRFGTFVQCLENNVKRFVQTFPFHSTNVPNLRKFIPEIFT